MLFLLIFLIDDSSSERFELRAFYLMSIRARCLRDCFQISLLTLSKYKQFKGTLMQT